MKWAVFVREDKRPPILNEDHADFIKPLRWIPRAWTSWLGDPPRKVWGTAPLDRRKAVPMSGNDQDWYPKPIPDRGYWWFGWPLYFAIQTKGRWHFRIGFRYDDVDRYYVISTTLKRYRP